MSSIADFEFNASPLSEGVILVSQSVRRDFPAADVERKLQQLVDEARAAVPVDITQEQQLDALIELFYKTGASAAPAACTACRTPSGWTRCWKGGRARRSRWAPFSCTSPTRWICRCCR